MSKKKIAGATFDRYSAEKFCKGSKKGEGEVKEPKRGMNRGEIKAEGTKKEKKKEKHPFSSWDSFYLERGRGLIAAEL